MRMVLIDIFPLMAGFSKDERETRLGEALVGVPGSEGRGEGWGTKVIDVDDLENLWTWNG